MEDRHEEGHEEGVDVLQVVGAPSEMSAPRRDGENPECCHASEIPGFCNMQIPELDRYSIQTFMNWKTIFLILEFQMVPPYDGDSGVVLRQALQQQGERGSSAGAILS